jgi:hypothetical protein
MIERCFRANDGDACQVYRAYLVNAEGHFISVHELYYRDDDEAIEQARRLASESGVELWARDRNVAYIPAP